MALLALLLLEASVNAEPAAARRLLGGADGGARQRAPPPHIFEGSDYHVKFQRRWKITEALF
jgi:hypothetical protein